MSVDFWEVGVTVGLIRSHGGGYVANITTTFSP
jgi:hypothetical protein